MPLLTVHLENSGKAGKADNNVCHLHLDADIRTQDVAVKQTRVHINDRLIYAGNATPNAFVHTVNGGQGTVKNLLRYILSGQGPPTKDFYGNYESTKNAMSVLHCIMSGYQFRYTIDRDAEGYNAATHLPFVKEGYYWGFANTSQELNKHIVPGNNNYKYLEFGFIDREHPITTGTTATANNVTTTTTEPEAVILTTTNTDHAYHVFEILNPPPLRLCDVPQTVYLEMPNTIKEEANGNVNGLGLIPCPVDSGKPTTVTNLHCILLMEKLSSGPVHLSKLKGTIPNKNEIFATAPLHLSDKYGGIKSIDLVLEYTTNNMYSSG